MSSGGVLSLGVHPVASSVGEVDEQNSTSSNSGRLQICEADVRGIL